MIDVETIFDSDREEYEFMKEKKEQPMKEQNAVTNEQAREALDRILNFCEEIDNHIPPDETTGYKMLPDYFIVSRYLNEADYRKQKEGEWVQSNIPQEKYVCSVCGGACWYYDCQGDVEKSRYCPNCGAKMKGE